MCVSCWDCMLEICEPTVFIGQTGSKSCVACNLTCYWLLRKCQCMQGPAEVSLVHIIFLLPRETSDNREQKLNLLDNVNVILHQNNIDTTYSFTPHQASCVVCFYISLKVTQSSFQTIHPIHMVLISGMKSHKLKHELACSKLTTQPTL